MALNLSGLFTFKKQFIMSQISQLCQSYHFITFTMCSFTGIEFQSILCYAGSNFLVFTFLPLTADLFLVDEITFYLMRRQLPPFTRSLHLSFSHDLYVLNIYFLGVPQKSNIYSKLQYKIFSKYYRICFKNQLGETGSPCFKFGI